MTEKAFAGLVLALSQVPDSRVSIETLTLDWSYALCPSLGAAVAKLMTIFQTATCDNEGYFKADRRRIDSLPHGDPLALVISGLQDAGEPISPVDLWTRIDRHLDGRFVLVSRPGESGPLQMLTWGSGYKRFTDTILGAMSRNFIESQPDRAYARSAATRYDDAYHSDEAIVEDITTSTWWQGRGRVVARYTRALLRIQLVGGRSCILSSSRLLEVN